MPFTRDPVPIVSDAFLRSYLERTFQELDDWTARVSATLDELVRLKEIEGLEIRLRWDDTIDVVATPAAAGFVKGNDNVPAQITQFSMSTIDEFGRLVVTGSQLVPTQDGFYEINDLSRSTIMRYTLTSTTLRDTDILVDVTVDEIIGSNPQANDQVEVTYWPAVIPAELRAL